MNKKEVLSIEKKVTVIRQIENGKKKADMCRELSPKFCDPNDFKKERNQDY